MTTHNNDNFNVEEQEGLSTQLNQVNTINFEQQENNLQMIMQLAQTSYQQLKDMKEIRLEVRHAKAEIMETKEELMQVGSFMVDFFNEYRQDDRITQGQKKVLFKTMKEKTSEITKILFPRLAECYEKNSTFYKEWFLITQGVWSIYRHRVNNNSCGYSETPKMKFNSALSYVESLGISDYLAYKDFRWKDIRPFICVLEPEDRVTIESIINKNKLKDEMICLN